MAPKVDDEIVEAMTGALVMEYHLDPPDAREEATFLLAAVRVAGFDVYRVADAEQTTVLPELKDRTGHCWFGYVPAGTYRLVPVETPKETTET